MIEIPISKPNISAAEKTAVLSVLDSGFIAQGPRTAEFESRFTKISGTRHAIAVSSGTSALQIALLAHGIGPGDEVITTPFSFIATATSVLFVGATPVFVDIEEDTYNLNPDLVEAAITPRTRAIMPVHLYGQMCDMDKLTAIAEKYGLIIIEDACQAVMASYKGRAAGSFGTGAFSFFATKNLTTGEGGMITTDDDDIAAACRMIRHHGMKRRYYHDMLGYNFRMTDFQAAIGLAQIDRLAEFTSQRRANARYFNNRINAVATPQTREACDHVWHQYTVRTSGRAARDAAVAQLTKAGIGTGIYYPIPIHKQKSMKHVGAGVSLPVAERMADKVFSLPVHPQLTITDLERIALEVNRL